MNSELISRLESIQEYLKIDQSALRQEIDKTTEMINDLRVYKSNLRRIELLTRTIKESVIDDNLKNQLVDVMSRYPQLRSIREAEVMLHCLQAKPNKVIADDLCVTEKTIKYHKTNIFKRCGFKNTMDMIKHNYSILNNGLPIGAAK